jgi:HK97 family phage major capsid protein
MPSPFPNAVNLVNNVNLAGRAQRADRSGFGGGTDPEDRPLRRGQDEVIADFTQFREVVTTEMLAGLVDAENGQLLEGSGTAPDLVGLVATSGIQTVGSAGTDLDAVAKAMNMVRTAVFMEPDIVVMHPNDWASTGFQLAKDSTGQYLVRNPLQATTPMLWGVPVLLTTRQTENTLVVAN